MSWNASVSVIRRQNGWRAIVICETETGTHFKFLSGFNFQKLSVV